MFQSFFTYAPDNLNLSTHAQSVHVRTYVREMANIGVMPSPPLNGTYSSRNELIKDYFMEGYRYEVILHFLAMIHGISLSLRQLNSS